MENDENLSLASNLSEISAPPLDLIRQMCEFIYAKDALTRVERLETWIDFREMFPNCEETAQELKIFFFTDVLPRIPDIYADQLNYRRRYFAGMPFNPMMIEIATMTSEEIDQVHEGVVFAVGASMATTLLSVEQQQDNEFFKWFFGADRILSHEEIVESFKQLHGNLVELLEKKLNEAQVESTVVVEEASMQSIPIDDLGSNVGTPVMSGFAHSTPQTSRQGDQSSQVEGSSRMGGFSEFRKRMVSRTRPKKF